MKASDNPFPSALFAEQGSDPATPDSGNWRLFFKAGGLYAVDDGGTVVGPFATAAGSITTVDATMSAASTTLSTSYTDIAGLSISCVAGTWLFFTNLLFEAVGATRSIYAKVWDGTTIFDEFEGSCASAERQNLAHSSIPVVLGSTTTVKVSARVDAGGSNLVDRDGGHSTTQTPTNIVALRIA